MRESGCCTLAGSGVLIRWKEALSCWWMHEEETDRGTRRAAEFTPRLEKAPSYPVPPFLLPPRFLLRSVVSPVPSLGLFPSSVSFFHPSPFPVSVSPAGFPSRSRFSTLHRFRRPSSSASSTFSAASSSCFPASLTPRGQTGRCTHSYLPAAFGPLPRRR